MFPFSSLFYRADFCSNFSKIWVSFLVTVWTKCLWLHCIEKIKLERLIKNFKIPTANLSELLKFLNLPFFNRTHSYNFSCGLSSNFACKIDANTTLTLIRSEEKTFEENPFHFHLSFQLHYWFFTNINKMFSSNTRVLPKSSQRLENFLSVKTRFIWK